MMNFSVFHFRTKRGKIFLAMPRPTVIASLRYRSVFAINTGPNRITPGLTM
ncbi:hypothetical protein CKO_04475 [Citrobacter koseri ATCC BAA-895]|uniref:Uncharacterized protein n=1 Tax=Citrobacter koseri (strain ATCC BAA-895 / CDC 4225-83 / SGSC4696) TaxID=290338 RepID=A8APW6_CITK8|nr:hypothetical protein CKO_04475 [Citrobacter koseri ATCC BAA-895]